MAIVDDANDGYQGAGGDITTAAATASGIAHFARGQRHPLRSIEAAMRSPAARRQRSPRSLVCHPSSGPPVRRRTA